MRYNLQYASIKTVPVCQTKCVWLTTFQTCTRRWGRWPVQLWIPPVWCRFNSECVSFRWILLRKNKSFIHRCGSERWVWTLICRTLITTPWHRIEAISNLLAQRVSNSSFTDAFPYQWAVNDEFCWVFLHLSCWTNSGFTGGLRCLDAHVTSIKDL